MANKNVFGSNRVKSLATPVADTVNLAGGKAYSMTDKEALAQLIVTGTFNGTFYADAKSQIDTVTNLLAKLGPDNAGFIAKLAIYAREKGYMKDTPAFLTAWLTIHGREYVKQVFDRVIDNGKMLRNFVQIMRSGAVGRKSLGSGPKKMIQNWLKTANAYKLLSASVGNSPSLSDVIKMVHPTPNDVEQEVLFRWFLGHTVEDPSLLPNAIQGLIAFRNNDTDVVPAVPFELLTSLELSTRDWSSIAKTAGWQMTRMNINTFQRKGVLDDPKIVSLIAKRLADPEAIDSSRVMPYQLFTTWMYTEKYTCPIEIREALYSALDYTLGRVPKINGKTWVFVDVSGSMSSPITGVRGGSTTKMRCLDVAALIASSLLRTNPDNTEVIMFDTKVHTAKLNPRSNVMDNAETIARFGGGGTNCSLPLEKLLDRGANGDLIIYISDNESWIDNDRLRYRFNVGTSLAEAWTKFKSKNPKAKMVCIDLTPNTTTQNSNAKDVLNIGGFNDAVYGVIQAFVNQDGNATFWTDAIEESVTLEV